jgi:hypothetical protein
MARYDIYVFCDECSDSHRMGIVVNLNNGPADRDSIGNLYKGKEMPTNIGSLINHHAQCPNTGRWFKQEDNDQIFLAARPD